MQSKVVAIPIATLTFCTCCTAISVCYLSEADTGSWNALSKWGCPPAEEIWNGTYSALLSSVFVHNSWWHLVFNLFWLWLFGAAFERLFGTRNWLAFVIFAAVISSGIELTFVGHTGMGASGVVFAIFGFSWLAKRRYSVLEKVVPGKIVVLFLGWLVGCWILTIMDVVSVANVAHVTGLIVGVVVACRYVFLLKVKVMQIILALMTMAAIEPMFWAPWSVAWTSVKATDAYRARDFKRATELYLRSLELGQEPAWVWESLALTYGVSRDDVKYRDALGKLFELDPGAVTRVEHAVTNWRENR